MVLAPGTYYWPTGIDAHSPPLATRSGWLALAMLPFVLALSTKRNYISFLTGVSHDRLQVFHRHLAWVMRKPSHSWCLQFSAE